MAALLLLPLPDSIPLPNVTCRLCLRFQGWEKHHVLRHSQSCLGLVSQDALPLEALQGSLGRFSQKEIFAA